MIYRIIILFCAAYVLVNCGRSVPEPIPYIKLHGINGDALYKRSPEGQTLLVSKEDYINDDFNIVIVKDTIGVGQDFIGWFAIIRKHYKISITSPSVQTITSEDSINGKYIFTPHSLGVYDYQGQIEYDSIIVPFEFKFVVVP